MPTPEAETIAQGIYGAAVRVTDINAAIQRWAPAIDALALKRVVEMEASWRETLRIEREGHLNETRLKEHFKSQLDTARAEVDQLEYKLECSRD